MDRPTLSSYTEHPGMNPSVIFPNHGMQALSTILNLLGISAVSYCFARRTVYEKLWTARGWLNLSWPRFCVILVFLSSWAFIFSAGILISGTGMSLSVVTCMLGIFSCITWYALSKILIYAFLMEKVWIVWSSNSGTGLGSRWSSPIYRICFCIMLPYFAIIVLMIIGRIAELREHDRVCVIGLRRVASISLLSFDLFITVFLTSLFVWPLWSSNLISPKLRKVASRTLTASFVALITSAINVGVLSYMNGRQLGWVCLMSCGADVTVNAIVLFYATAGTSIKRTPSNALGPTAPTSTYPGMAAQVISTTAADGESPQQASFYNPGPNNPFRAIDHAKPSAPATDDITDNYKAIVDDDSRSSFDKVGDVGSDTREDPSAHSVVLLNGNMLGQHDPYPTVSLNHTNSNPNIRAQGGAFPPLPIDSYPRRGSASSATPSVRWSPSPTHLPRATNSVFKVEEFPQREQPSGLNIPTTPTRPPRSPESARLFFDSGPKMEANNRDPPPEGLFSRLGLSLGVPKVLVPKNRSQEEFHDLGLQVSTITQRDVTPSTPRNASQSTPPLPDKEPATPTPDTHSRIPDSSPSIRKRSIPYSSPDQPAQPTSPLPPQPDTRPPPA